MSGDLILAIDNGTQSVRAMAFDAHGTLVAKHQVSIEPYYSELGNFENKIGDYWDLPSLLTKGLAPNFEVQNFDAGGAVARKDSVAVLGVSAACAQDGSVCSRSA